MIAAYCRVSGDSQAEGDGIPRQRAAITAYAAKNGWTVDEWYIDSGV